MRLIRQIIVLILMAKMLTIAADGQEETIRVATELVTLNVAVTDKQGKPVLNLRRELFEIFDNGAKQEIEYFSGIESAVTFGIVFDMHPATAERTKIVTEALRQFTKELPAKDDFFFIAFNERGSLNLDFVPDAEQLEKNMASPDKREPRSLYDALYLAAGKLRERKNLKKTLIVITDSKDHSSRRKFYELREQFKSFDAQIYAVTPDDARRERWIYADVSRRRNGIPPNDNPLERAALGDLTMKSGGTTYSSELESQRDLSEIADRIAEETRRQYTVSFYPTTNADGKRHQLTVRLRLPAAQTKGWVLTYRQDYQSPLKNP